MTEKRLMKIKHKEEDAYEKSLENCRLERPLGRGELFALAMQDYWQRKMKRVWILDERLTDIYKDFDPLINKILFVEETCALQRDACGNPLRFGNDHCYPRKISHYPTLDTLFAKISGNRYNSYENIVDGVLQGQIYRPDEDAPIYRPEFHDSDADFAIIVRNGDDTDWYDNDCCRLLNYTEMEEDHHLLKGYGLTRIRKKQLHEGYFLRIKIQTVDSGMYHANSKEGVLSLSRGERYSDKTPLIIYYRVSPCGKLISQCAECIF